MGAEPSTTGRDKLFQPVASAAGLIEANGYSVAVSGVDIVRQDETCSEDGKSWACGIRARTAFRSFLRGRAVACKVPPEADRNLIAAECRIGRLDVGQWLVENGWARAVAGGPYVEASDKARAARKGIFGAAPDLGGLPPAPMPVAAPTASQPILDAPATDGRRLERKLRRQLTRQRPLNEGAGFGNAVKCGERAETRAAFLSDQHLVDHLEEGT